jgi:hypothetical protein
MTAADTLTLSERAMICHKSAVAKASKIVAISVNAR